MVKLKDGGRLRVSLGKAASMKPRQWCGVLPRLHVGQGRGVEGLRRVGRG